MRSSRYGSPRRRQSSPHFPHRHRGASARERGGTWSSRMRQCSYRLSEPTAPSELAARPRMRRPALVPTRPSEPPSVRTTCSTWTRHSPGHEMACVRTDAAVSAISSPHHLLHLGSQRTRVQEDIRLRRCGHPRHRRPHCLLHLKLTAPRANQAAFAGTQQRGGSTTPTFNALHGERPALSTDVEERVATSARSAGMEPAQRTTDAAQESPSACAPSGLGVWLRTAHGRSTWSACIEPTTLAGKWRTHPVHPCIAKLFRRSTWNRRWVADGQRPSCDHLSVTHDGALTAP